MRQDFFNRIKLYFKDNYDEFIKELSNKRHHSFFLNTKKENEDKILSIIDFNITNSKYNDISYIHNNDNIGKTIVNDLGLIYPQNIESSLPAKCPSIKKDMLILDMCAAPGGKTINILNRVDDNSLLIANEISYPRAEVLVTNLERLGLSNCIVTNKKIKDIAEELEGLCDLVIVDAPCSGEGIVRKYPEIIDNYSIENIKELSNIQKDILDNAYLSLKKDGELLYSTCTYSYEEDEEQIKSFLDRHKDMSIINISGYPSISKLEGTIKMSILDGTEGQFFCLMKRNSSDTIKNNIKYLISIKNKIVDEFIINNLNVDSYYLYEHNNHYYLSFLPLYNLKNNVLRYGIYIGDIKNGKRFEPSHCLYRSNLLKGKFKNVYDINDNEFKDYISGLELKANICDGYYLITYKNQSLGYVKASKGILKNKYPKGLRRMV